MASPMQFCMETSDWLKAIIPDEGAADVTNSSSSSPSGELTPCPLLRPAGPMLDRRLRPPHDQALRCPRCDSGHTKFCYYNNYSLSQPRYFCKACRRYWTKGGSLRNVPIGGGCRKNKRPAAAPKNNKPPTAADQIQSIINRHHQHHHHHQAELGRLSGLNFMFDGVPGCSHFAAGLDLGLGDHNGGGGAPLGGYSVDEACQRLAMPFGEADVKPGNRMLSLEWPEQGCGDSFGYSSPLGLWAGMINGHGP